MTQPDYYIDRCIHCNEVIRVNPNNGYGVHVTGSHSGLGRCGQESGQPYGLNAHPQGVACTMPCAGTYEGDT